jgi:hypothetical protein
MKIKVNLMLVIILQMSMPLTATEILTKGQHAVSDVTDPELANRWEIFNKTS